MCKRDDEFAGDEGLGGVRRGGDACLRFVCQAVYDASENVYMGRVAYAYFRLHSMLLLLMFAPFCDQVHMPSSLSYTIIYSDLYGVSYGAHVIDVLNTPSFRRDYGVR